MFLVNWARDLIDKIKKPKKGKKEDTATTLLRASSSYHDAIKPTERASINVGNKAPTLPFHHYHTERKEDSKILNTINPVAYAPKPPIQSNQFWCERKSNTGKDENSKDNLEESLRRLRISQSSNNYSQQDIIRRALGPSQLPIAGKQNQQLWLEENTGPLVHSISEKPKENFQLSDKFILKDNEITFYTLKSWPEILSTYEGVDFKGDPIRKIEMYSLPKNYNSIFEKDLDLKTEDLTFYEKEFLKEFLSQFKKPPKLGGFDEFCYTAVKESNYQKFFHDLLYIEEYENVNSMSHYNMTEVKMLSCEDEREFKLEVPGLAEKRPNILKNDHVYVRIHTHPTAQYSGWVKEVLKDSIIIADFREELVQYVAKAKSRGKEVFFDVRFTSCRYIYYLQHFAIDIVSSDILDVLFPSSKATSYRINNFAPNQFRPMDFVNYNIEKNSEQKKAVMNILGRTSGFAPYIIFGPPGTGKTAAFIEAVLQVKLRKPDSHILVCSQNNGICDQIASKLYSSGKCSKEEIIRLVASSKKEDVEGGISDITRTCSNKELESIRGYRIIVCTLITAGRIVENNDFMKKRMKKRRGNHYEEHTFTHLFIDEAGQASECQTLIPIAGLLKKGGERSLLVLAGDPKQLGPCCTGLKSEKFGLGVSLLERLMANFSIYQPNVYGQYDSRFITQLVKNYRSHEEILTISNQLFYKNTLEPQGVEDDLCYFALNKKPISSGRPILFHGVKGQEERDPKSRSMWNREEVSMVVEYILKLIDYEIKDEDYEVIDCIDPDEIGVIAPYFLQVQKIKQEFQKQQKLQPERLKRAKENNERKRRFNWEKIEVGSTETFQGREKRVIIVSTVRSRPDVIGRYPIGFVKDPKRFNVIMTRAQAKQIVIGNPEALKQDWCWKFLLKTCLDNKEYYGCPFIA